MQRIFKLFMPILIHKTDYGMLFAPRTSDRLITETNNSFFMSATNCSSTQSMNDEGSSYRDILLVDDESELLLIVGDLLRTKGFDVITAPNAQRAMQQLDENKVGLVILDINLAGEDGVRFMSFIKLNHPEVPVMLYTGLSHDEQQVQTMLAQGATCYVNKGQTPADLLFAVQQVIAIH